MLSPGDTTSSIGVNGLGLMGHYINRQRRGLLFLLGWQVLITKEKLDGCHN